RVLDEEQGSYQWIDRMGDFCRVRGENVSTFEVESLLCTHPGVRVASAFGVRAHEGGEEDVVAFVVPAGTPPVTESELRAHIDAVMPKYMRPTRLLFVEELPQTPSGKVQKHHLKEILREQGMQPI